MFICECGKEFEKINGMTGHQANCKVHKEILLKEKESKRLPNGMFKCENCGKEHDGSYGSGRFCSAACRRSWCGKRSYIKQIQNGTFISGFKRKQRCNPAYNRSPYGTWKCEQCNLIFETRDKLYNHKHEVHLTLNTVWSKGLTAKSDPRIAKIRQTLLDGYKSGRLKPSFIGKHHSEETKRRLALKGGKRSHSGRGKQGRYHGIWCDSSWELAWVIYQEEHQIKFKKYHGYFEYEFEGQKHKYYPDFELEDGTIVEIKGYWSKQWQAKLDQLPKDRKLLILGKNEMAPILEYVKAKYGDNFIQLYENTK